MHFGQWMNLLSLKVTIFPDLEQTAATLFCTAKECSAGYAGIARPGVLCALAAVKGF